MMKTMTKIKLVNWHIFNNHTIEIKGNTLITGENGHGKSTLLDAVNYVLSGATGKFNQAANAYTKRSIESYIRGKTGVEGKTYIRNQDNLISHISIEFFDLTSKKYLVIGVCFELPFTSKNNFGTFYHINDSKLCESFYTRDKKILGIKQLIAAVEGERKSVKTFTLKREIKSMVKSTLGISNQKYFDLLPKALAFHPINEVNKFVYDFLLPKDNVDIESLKANIFSYRHISKLLKIEKEKLTILNPLEKIAQEFENSKKEIKILTCLNLELKLEDIQNKIIKKNELIHDLQEEEHNLVDLKSSINSKLSEIDVSLNELRSNDQSIRMVSLEKMLDDELNQYNTLLQKIDILIKNIEYERKNSNKLGIDFSVPLNLNKENFNKLKKAVIKLDEELEEIKNNINVDLSTNDSHTVDLMQRKQQIYKDIENLKAKRFTYSDNVTLLISLLKTELSLAYNTDLIEVKPLCELLEIDEKNEIWRNSIEGYLNTQRFDIIVEPQYFDKALEIYKKYNFKRKIHGVGLVNTEKLKNYIEQEDSLATKVKGLNEYARQYINMIMGNVICVNDINELKRHKKSITVNGMTYSNNTARQINHKIWEKPYIGLNAIKIQLKKAIEKEKRVINELERLVQLKKVLLSQKSIIDDSRMNELINIPNYFGSKFQKEENIESINRELEVLRKDNAWLAIEAIIKKKKDLKIDLNLELEKCIGEVSVNKNKQENTLNELKDLKANLQELNDEEDKIQDFSQYFEGINEKKKIIKKVTNNNFDKAYIVINNKKAELNKLIVKQENRIVFSMREYILKYDDGLFIDNINNLNDFLDLLHKIRNRNIIEYEDNAKQALKACEKSFKEDFLSKLREKMQTAQENFRTLNRSLKTKPFGSDEEVYEFTYKGSKNPDFKDYYSILQSYEDYESRSLLIESLSEKNLILLKTLFDVLTSEDNTESQVKRIMEYTDYRKYMDYDIKITNRNNEVYYFSKVNREKSGGETQTPFYVIIASSFQQLLESSKRNRSSACVVMFDEAFNNMDESRIEAMMKYYKELNIQLLIAVPPQRLINIIPYVETTLGLVKTNDTVVVCPYKQVSEDKYHEEV